MLKPTYKMESIVVKDRKYKIKSARLSAQQDITRKVSDQYAIKNDKPQCKKTNDEMQ